MKSKVEELYWLKQLAAKCSDKVFISPWNAGYQIKIAYTEAYCADTYETACAYIDGIQKGKEEINILNEKPPKDFFYSIRIDDSKREYGTKELLINSRHIKSIYRDLFEITILLHDNIKYSVEYESPEEAIAAFKKYQDILEHAWGI